MKLIHLSDLHLGKRVNEFSMLEDQQYILKEILQIMDRERPQAVIIAGDVYDKSVPSAEAVTLLDDFLVRLSRRKVQERARAWLEELPPGTVLPVTVTHLEPFGAFVDAGCGVSSLICVERISISRIPHPSQRFQVGDEVYAVVLAQDRANRRLRLTHRELLGTWSENAQSFSAGMTVPGIARSVLDYGIFVELTPNLSGLAEVKEGISEGDRVSVFVKAVLPQRMKCKLLVIDKLPPAPPLPCRYFLPAGGRMDRWDYAPAETCRPAAQTIFEDAGQ